MFIHKLENGASLILPEDPTTNDKVAVVACYVPEDGKNGAGLLCGSVENLVKILSYHIMKLAAGMDPKEKRFLVKAVGATLAEVAQGAEGIQIITMTRKAEDDDGH